MAVAGESRTDRRVPYAPPVRYRSVHHVLSDGGTGYDKQHHVARRAGYGKDAGGGNAGHEPIPGAEQNINPVKAIIQEKECFIFIPL